MVVIWGVGRRRNKIHNKLINPDNSADHKGGNLGMALGATESLGLAFCGTASLPLLLLSALHS